MLALSAARITSDHWRQVRLSVIAQLDAAREAHLWAACVVNYQRPEGEVMKPIVAGLALVVSGVIAAPSVAQQPQTTPSEPAHKVFVFTGCLTSTAAATEVFKLTGAVPVGQAPKEGLVASPSAKNEYELLSTGLTEQGVARAEMLTHVGKKVEVTVRPVEVVPSPSSSSAPAAPTPNPEQAARRYTVTAIKSLANSCR